MQSAEIIFRAFPVRVRRARDFGQLPLEIEIFPLLMIARSDPRSAGIIPLRITRQEIPLGTHWLKSL